MSNYTLLFVTWAILGSLILGFVTEIIPQLLGSANKELQAKEFETLKKMRARKLQGDKLLDVKAMYPSGDMMYFKVAIDGQEMRSLLPVKMVYNPHTRQLDIPASALHPSSTIDEFENSNGVWEWEGKMTADGVYPEGMQSASDQAGGSVIGWKHVADIQAGKEIAKSTILDTHAAAEDAQEKQAKNVKDMLGGARMSRGDKGQ